MDTKYNFYEELQNAKEYSIRTAAGRIYEFSNGCSDFKYSEEHSVIAFTMEDDVRLILNVNQIEDIKIYK